MTYDKMPVMIGRANESGNLNAVRTGIPNGFFEIGIDSRGREYTHGGRIFYATDVSVDFNINAELNKKATGIDRARTYKNTERVSCDININFMFTNDHHPGYDDPYLFLRDDMAGGNATGESYYPIVIGRNVYNKCYLNSFTVTVEPFKPITCSANFSSFFPSSGEVVKHLLVDQTTNASSPNILMDPNSFAYGHTCGLSPLLEEYIPMDSLSSLTFTRTYERQEVYCLGAKIPKEILTNKVENTLTVKGTGLKKTLPSEGYRIDGLMYFIMNDLNNERIQTKPQKNGVSDNVDEGLYIHEGAYVVGSSYRVSQNNTVESTLVIKEPIK